MKDENSLMKKVFISQLKYPSEGDQTSEVTHIQEELIIQKVFDEIKDISKNRFTKIIKLAIENIAFKYIISTQKQKTKKEKKNYYKQFSLQP